MAALPSGNRRRKQNVAKLPALQENKDFKRLYYRGKSYAHPALVIYFMRNRAGFSRIGLTASRKIGNAVTRNRARRVIREAYRAVSPEIVPGYDIVFVARGKTARMKSTELQPVMKKLFCEAGLYRNAERAGGEKTGNG